MLQLSCLDNYLIQIVRANYGRFSIEICNEMGRTDFSVNCISNQSSYILQQRYVQNTIIFSLKNLYYLLTTSLISIGFYKYSSLFPFLALSPKYCNKLSKRTPQFPQPLETTVTHFQSLSFHQMEGFLGFPSRIFFL